MRIKIIIPTLVITFILGIVIGQSVIAGGVTPGSQADPLVTKAFVENTLNSQVMQLQQQVAQLQAKANTLQQQVEFLENQLGAKAPVQNQNPPTNIQTPPENQTVPPVTNQPKQKVCYPKESNKSDVVNVRSGTGTNFDIVAKVKKGSKMIILDEKNGWYRVKLEDGKLAWVANYVVDVREE
jgi:outer membrane murein-binding lipoprotein Lpp